MKLYGFPKRERLRSQKFIQELFEKGSSLFLYPFKIVYLLAASKPILSAPFPQVLISVPRKHFRRAHDRNLIKRRCREIYRLYKPEWLAKKQTLPALLAIIYLGKQHEPFAFMQKRLITLLNQVNCCPYEKTCETEPPPPKVS